MGHIQSKRSRSNTPLSNIPKLTDNKTNPPDLSKLNCIPVGLWNSHEGFIPGQIELHDDRIEFIPQTRNHVSTFTVPLHNIVTVAYRNNMVLPFLQQSITLIKQKGPFLQLTYERVKEAYHSVIFKINAQGHLFYKAIKIQMNVNKFLSP